VSYSASTLRGKRKKDPAYRLSPFVLSEIEAEATVRDKGFMPNRVSEKDVAAILAAREGEGGPRTIGDIYPALAE